MKLPTDEEEYEDDQGHFEPEGRTGGLDHADDRAESDH